MNEFSDEDDTILTRHWKRGDDGEIMAEYFPREIRYMAMEMWTNGGLK